MTTDDASIAWQRRRALFREVAADAKHAGVEVILFNWYGVDIDAKRVQGFVPRDREWVAAERPLPDAVYEMTSYADRSEREGVRAVCKRLADECGIPFVNRLPPFGKWRVYEVLRARPETKHLQPETMPFADLESLRQMVRRHGTVYVKDSYGSRGKSVMRIRADGSLWRLDRWRLEGSCRGQTVDGRFPTLAALHRFLEGLDLKNWVLQQGVNGPQVKGRTFDLRVMVQKDGRGQWGVAVSGLRWSRHNDVVNNVSQGAIQIDPAGFVQQYGPDVRGLDTFEARAAAASMQVAHVLEEQFGTIGEIGVDVGIDRDGRVWVFEVNPKPGRFPGYAIHRRVFAYAGYLARRKQQSRAQPLTR